VSSRRFYHAGLLSLRKWSVCSFLIDSGVERLRIGGSLVRKGVLEFISRLANR
jgi:hypothetical protein